MEGAGAAGTVQVPNAHGSSVCPALLQFTGLTGCSLSLHHALPVSSCALLTAVFTAAALASQHKIGDLEQAVLWSQEGVEPGEGGEPDPERRVMRTVWTRGPNGEEEKCSEETW